MAEPVLWAPMNVANQELDASEEEDEVEEDQDEYEDGAEDELRDEIKRIPYQVCQVISTLILTVSCTLAVYGLEASLDSPRDREGALSAQLLSRLKLWAPAIVVPTLFLTLPESLGRLRRNVRFLAVYAVLAAPFLLLPLLLPASCPAPDTANMPLPRRTSTLGDHVYSLLAWTLWYGPVFLISIISVVKLIRTANMPENQPEQQEPVLPEESGLWIKRARG